MKKNLTIASALILVTSMMILMASCSGNNHSKDVSDTEAKPEIMVLAAASLTDALNEIIAAYEKNAACTVTASYAGSGDLVQQIESGAPCDIFISASTSNMDRLEAGGYIDAGTRCDLLFNRLTLIAAAEVKDTVTMDTLTSGAVKTIAIGEPETVPAGKYATQVFDHLGIADRLSDQIIYSKDVRTVLNYVETGNADCGFVYRTDALLLDESSGAVINDVDKTLHDPIRYPAAILTGSPCMLEGGAAAHCLTDFYGFLRSDFAKDIFKAYGFTVK